MRLPRFRLEATIRIFLGISVVSLLAGQVLDSPPLQFVGGAMLGLVMAAAIVAGAVLLAARVFQRTEGKHTAQQGAQPDPNKPGDSGSS